MFFFNARDELATPPIRPDGLQIDERPRLQKVFWRVERVSWILFLLAVLAAVAGLTGAGGYLSRQVLELGDAQVDLPRISRWQTAETMTLTIPGTEKRHVLRVSNSFAEHFAIEQIVPEPRRSSVADGAIEFEFAAEGPGAHFIAFGLRPTRPGTASFDIAVDGISGRAGATILP
ncbi:hypothetical protein [Microbaculum marinum]|uniref:Cytochrome c oxidase accessory protein CcoG n=1 Tax=Microbaculum marinum TaxID=1764581 RepID=A0AAW9RNT9_9HYPH